MLVTKQLTVAIDFQWVANVNCSVDEFNRRNSYRFRTIWAVNDDQILSELKPTLYTKKNGYTFGD